MKKRNKIASIVLFLAALVVGFDAQPGWCGWSYLYPPYNMSQCTIDVSPLGGAVGMAVLPDGRVLVATAVGLYYFQSFPSDPTQCPGPTDGPFFLNNVPFLSLTMGLDGKVYAFKRITSYTSKLVTVNGYDGTVTEVCTNPTCANENGLGMALDPLTGDLYWTDSSNPDQNRIFRYCASCTPKVTTFATVPDQNHNTTILDGLAWSCDGRFLFVGSPNLLGFGINNQVYRFNRAPIPNPPYVVATLPGAHYGPDGIAVGAEGTDLAGYVFSNNNDGSVTRFTSTTSTFGSPLTIANGAYPDRGDFAFVDAQGAMVAIQGLHLQRLSSTVGQWVVPGSTLCSDLRCGAKAATTTQFGIISPAAPHPCLSGLNANLVLTLSQSACGSCESCNTLNQARTTLLDLLNSLDPPRTCLNSLKATLVSLYNSCPCNCPCTGCNCPPYCLETKLLGGGTCIAQTKFPLGFDLESYDPILQAFIRELMSP